MAQYPKVKLLVVLVCCQSLIGCTVGPDYCPPCIDTPNSYRYKPKKVAETANTKWWQQFKDPVLDSLIAEALANNKNVKIAAANIEQAIGVLLTTRSALFPQFTYSATGTRTLASKNLSIPISTQNPFNNFEVLGGATWEIDLWGRIRRLSESAKATVLATYEARKGVILSLVAELGISYIQLRGLDEQLIISKNTLNAYRESVVYFEKQYKYGQISLVNVEQARSQYETAAAQIPQIETQIAVLEQAISILLGRNPGPIPRGKSINNLVMPVIPKGLPSDLLCQRPDILQAEQQLIAANAEIGAAKALYFPAISLTGAYGRASSSLSNLFSSKSTTWNYGGSITGPIFTAGNIEGQVVQAESATLAQELNYKLTIQKAFADVNNALISKIQLEKQLAAEKKRVLAYQNYKKLSWLKYNEGYSPYLEVLFAETQLFPAELSAVQTKAATLASLINIYRAMGGGWVDKADCMTRE